MAGSPILDGQGALVTGAGTGLGRASALALAAEGARVVVTELPDRLDRAEQTVADIKAAGGDGLAVPLNVLDLSQIGFDATNGVRQSQFQGDVLAEKDHVRIARHFLGNAAGDGVAIADFRHLSFSRPSRRPHRRRW